MESLTNMQIAFIESLKNNKKRVMLFLQNGIKLKGIISNYDKNHIILEENKKSQLVFIHSIATICPE